MKAPESLEHRERRLMQLGDAVEGLLEEGWVYWLIIGKPGELDSTNIVSNVPPPFNEQIRDMLLEIARRYKAGVKPSEL